MILQLSGIRKSYGEKENRVEALKGIDLGVNEGEFCVLLGPSGSGKSTLLNIIGGIDSADEGEIIVRGERMSSMKPSALTKYRRNHLGYIFQMYNLIPNLTVRENIEVGAYLSDHPLDIEELLHTLGLYEHQDKLPNQLSGGQQQRTSIGRAIIKNPDILLCDEPTGALDSATSKEILKLIETVNLKYGNTVIMVTHNESIKYMADGVGAVHDGVSQLAEGMGVLPEASGALSEGYDQILEGTWSLADGMKEFDEQGIQEIAKLGSGQMKDMIRRAKALRLADGEYVNYAGITEGTKGSVRFLIETGKIETD